MTLLWLLLAAFAGGASTALAGGGTFIVFPALLFAGVASVKANATATLIMVPGGIASGWVYRKSMVGIRVALVGQLLAASFAGSIVGSWLLLNTSNRDFSRYLPWLMLIAAASFTATPRLRRLAKHSRSLWIVLPLQFLISVYGGYFGAGMGVLMLALYVAALNMDVHPANGLRLLCAIFVNMIALVLFAWRGAIDWSLGVPMLLAGIVGGYLGARVVRQMNERLIRNCILTYSWGLTIYFFMKELAARSGS